MFEQITTKLPGPPEFILCVPPERKNPDIYGPWKKRSLSDFGIATQCVSPTKINDQYLTNVLLKINSKLGGTNSLLAMEHASRVPMIKDTPTMILGMDVSHGSPGRSDAPSIAAVVGSQSWPLISRYRAAVRTQSSKVEMIEALFKPSPNGKDDDGIMRELLLDFYNTSNGRKPSQIVVFRDGVSESQFNQVLNHELDQMIKAGMIGTSRPAHYHVLVDEIGFPPDDLQNLIHSLSYVYQRSTTAISIVAPICYAHLAAVQKGQFMKFDEFADNSSGRGSLTSSAGSIPVPELPRLHKNVAGSMFFC